MMESVSCIFDCIRKIRMWYVSKYFRRQKLHLHSKWNNYKTENYELDWAAVTEMHFLFRDTVITCEDITSDYNHFNQSLYKNASGTWK